MPRWHRVLTCGRLVWTGTDWRDKDDATPRLFPVSRANAAARSVAPPPQGREAIVIKPAMLDF